MNEASLSPGMGQGGLESIPPPLSCSRGSRSKDSKQKKERKSPAAQRSTRTGQSFRDLEIRTRPEGAKAKEDEATGHGVISGDWGPSGRGLARN